ncbi:MULTISPECIES: hypothetical protein [Chitinophagaceae]
MILVFMTSVNDAEDVLGLTPLLNKLQPSGWRFDLEDCDKILRMDTLSIKPEEIIELLQQHGFDYTELLN